MIIVSNWVKQLSTTKIIWFARHTRIVQQFLPYRLQIRDTGINLWEGIADAFAAGVVGSSYPLY